MGQGGNNPMREGGAIMSQYQVDEQNIEHMVTYLTHKQNKQQFIFRQLTFNEIRQFTNTQEKLHRREKISHHNLTNLVTMQERTEDQMCSNFYKIYTLWEYPRHTLMDEISLRALNKKPFEEQDLWRILSGTTEGMAALQSNDLRHQALSTKTILLDKERNIKVADPNVLGTQSNLETIYSNRHQKNIYLSPQQCEFIQSNKPALNKNAFKNDVYTMGVIMLECATLERQDACYLDQCARVNQAEIARRLNQVGSTYGERMRRATESMLGTDIRRRPDWIQLSQMLKEHNVSPRIQTNLNNNTTFSFSGQSPRVTQRQSNGLQASSSYAGVPLGLSTIPSVSHEGGSTLYGQSHMTSSPQPGVSTIQQGTQSTHPSMPIHSVYKSNQLGGGQVRRPSHESSSPLFSATGVQNRPTIEFKATSQIPQFSIPPPVASPVQPSQSTVNSMPSPYPQPPYFHANTAPPQSNENQPLNTYQSQSSNSPQFVEQYFKMGSRYQGYKLNGMRHGFGKFFYQDGGRYEGDWKQNKMNGVGKLFYQSNKLAYDGQWINDQFQGKGTLYNEQPVPLSNTFDYRNFDQIQDYWQLYEGYFKQDLKSGRGMLKFSNGETFQGIFVEDMVQGQGVYKCRDGTVVKGVWSQNQLTQYLT